MVNSLVNVLNIIATPSEVFEKLKEQPQWLLAFALISIVTIGIAFFTIPLTKQITYLALSQSQNLEEEQLRRAVAMSERFQYVGLAFVPVLLLFRWLVLGAVLYCAAILLGANELRFKQVYAALVFAEMILLLMAIINILLIHIKGIDSLHHITDLQAIIGLDYLLEDKATHVPLFMFLNSINIFNIWYVATLTIGVSVMTNFSKLKSAMVVSTVWLLGVGFQVAVAAISSRAAGV
jgi:hypothetical protein